MGGANVTLVNGPTSWSCLNQSQPSVVESNLSQPSAVVSNLLQPSAVVLHFWNFWNILVFQEFSCGILEFVFLEPSRIF